MRNIVSGVSLALLFSACAAPENDGIPRIRSQRDVEAYNATVSDPGQKLVCVREVMIGTNFRPYVCLTVAQHEQRAVSDKQRIADVFRLVE